MTVGEVHCDLDPFPALGGDMFRVGLQFFGDKGFEKPDIFKPATVVLLEEIAHDDTARVLVGADADEQHAAIRRADGFLRQHAPDLIRLLAVGPLERVPDLELARMVRCHGERHELLERHAILGIDVEKLLRHRGDAQALLDDIDADEIGGRDVFVA